MFCSCALPSPTFYLNFVKTCAKTPTMHQLFPVKWKHPSGNPSGWTGNQRSSGRKCVFSKEERKGVVSCSPSPETWSLFLCPVHPANKSVGEVDLCSSVTLGHGQRHQKTVVSPDDKAESASPRCITGCRCHHMRRRFLPIKAACARLMD